VSWSTVADLTASCVPSVEPPSELTTTALLPGKYLDSPASTASPHGPCAGVIVARYPNKDICLFRIFSHVVLRKTSFVRIGLNLRNFILIYPRRLPGFALRAAMNISCKESFIFLSAMQISNFPTLPAQCRRT
jgi:hypothetical protein